MRRKSWNNANHRLMMNHQAKRCKPTKVGYHQKAGNRNQTGRMMIELSAQKSFFHLSLCFVCTVLF
jgi:hypothetical protein